MPGPVIRPPAARRPERTHAGPSIFIEKSGVLRVSACRPVVVNSALLFCDMWPVCNATVSRRTPHNCHEPTSSSNGCLHCPPAAAEFRYDALPKAKSPLQGILFAQRSSTYERKSHDRPTNY